MSGENFNISAPGKRILVAPLEWGLGHATRCIPIIQELLALNCDVLIGAEAAAHALLEKEFPQLQFLPLKGYRMKYSRNAYWLPAKILLQFPKIISSIYNERRWLKKAIRNHSIDAVISDNRFGFYNSSVPCIYMTHQLTIKTGNRFTESIAQKIHYRFINKYRECWVPDNEGPVNLAGVLSHPIRLPKIPLRYIGPLSRLEKKEVEKKYDLAVIISGPEPQRTLFEKLLLDQLSDYAGTVLFVRGLPGNSPGNISANSKIKIHDHLSSDELNEAIQRSSMIISRSGYTTVMDLVKLQKPAILIPTPGQPEQEYLADYLMGENIFYCVAQKDLLLKQALQNAAGFSFRSPLTDMDNYREQLNVFVNSINKKQGSMRV